MASKLNGGKRPFILVYLVIALALAGLAGLQRFGVAPLLERLPAGYSNEWRLLEENRFRASVADEWQTGTLSARRADQVIITSGAIAVLQADLHIFFESGAVNFESSGLYGVDRRTRVNLAGYGSAERSGLYLFPPHLKRQNYIIWDPMFIGPRQAYFSHAESLEGLSVDVYQFNATHLDETAGYSYLPEVPETYLAHTDGRGTIWVEPLSGAVVDYQDQGVSYFVDPGTGARVADFNQWSERFTAETKAAQLALARSARLRIQALETWLPGGVLLLGWLLLALDYYRRMAQKRRAG